MASSTLFRSAKSKSRRVILNRAGGRAFGMDDKDALAQYVVTGCFGDVFYATAEEQLEAVLKLGRKVAPEYLTRLAIYARTKTHMKDTPALLVAMLASRSPGLMAEVFDRVIDNGRMLRNFVQMVRSGVTGRRSFGSLPKRVVGDWLNRRPAQKLFFDSVGNDPSLADVIKLVHPKPESPERAALFAYLIGKPHDADLLPEIVQAFEKFKKQLRYHPTAAIVPDVPMQMLTGLPLSRGNWKSLAGNAPWQATRMNLNTFKRHGVFDDDALVRTVADRLADPAQVQRSRVLPYQLLIAYHQSAGNVPLAVREALQDAMEIATANVPELPGKVIVLPDVSASMTSPVTGQRYGGTSAVRCVDVAALVAASILRRNRKTQIVPFHDDVELCDVNPRDSVMTTAKRLSSLPSGGTDCAEPLRWLNKRKTQGDLVIFVSDNQSWLDTPSYCRKPRTTSVTKEWKHFNRNNPRAKLVCLDIQPYADTQAMSGRDVLNVGGFSDSVFEVIARFASGSLRGDGWTQLIEEVAL